MATITNADTGKFNSACPANTRKFILETYLAAKIANLMGVSVDSVNDLTPVRVDTPYINSEGVLKGYQKYKGWEKGLRIDLQKEQDGYACFQVQYGKGNKNDKNGGAYGGVLMLANTNFTFDDLRTALDYSFSLRPNVKYARLDP